MIIIINQLHGLWNPEALCRIHKGFSIIPILSLITQFLVLIPIYLRSILILSSHLRLGLPKVLFPVGVPVKIFLETFNNNIYPLTLQRIKLVSRLLTSLPAAHR